ncbi:5-aminolevulinate synthase [Schistosoma japonicum]|uniref:5-aminolevulinate synthase n=2 Tax=Schistosoma japonicum TaxID=6182 RepID=A0A4Z2CM96_SCHJA|nr:5-aminolevulinate synthase [Schistosoma japonicum]
MTSCPFLRKLSPAVIQKDIQQLIQLIPRCPFARRLFDGTPLSSPRMYSDVAVGPLSDELLVCKNVSECLLKKCPYTVNSYELTGSSAYMNSQTAENHTNEVFQKRSSGISDEMCIPNTCALFNGWQKSMVSEKHLHPTTTRTTMQNTDMENSQTINSMCCDNSSPGFDYNRFFASEVEKKKKDSTYRVFRRILRDASEFPFADDYSSGVKRRVAVWCSNDYLGMSWHPKVQEAAISTIRKHGVGSGGTRNISGNSLLHEELEAELSSLHEKPAALIFTSCYVANEAILHTLGTRIPELTIFSDAGNHASMIHGIRTSRCRKVIYRHNDVKHLSSLLAEIPSGSPKLVAFETVHSMSGDVCPLKSLLDVVEANKALSFVDEVHAVGLYGAHGAGVAERDGQMQRIDAITGTLGKAFASIGGYLAGTSELVDMIRSYASGFIFTTSLPPHCLAAARTSIQILKSAEGRELRTEHQRRVSIVRRSLREAGLPVIEAPSHIIPLHVGEAKLCTKISEELLSEHNIYVQSINYPTVDIGDERLRIAPTPHHTEKLTEELVDSLCLVWKKYNLPLNAESTRKITRQAG